VAAGHLAAVGAPPRYVHPQNRTPACINTGRSPVPHPHEPLKINHLQFGIFLAVNQHNLSVYAVKLFHPLPPEPQEKQFLQYPQHRRPRPRHRLRLAWIILLITCINFMNLATARSEQRAKEVGVRKVMGAAKGNLIGQFIGEALFLSFIAVALAVIVVYPALFLSSFNPVAVLKGIKIKSAAGHGMIRKGLVEDAAISDEHVLEVGTNTSNFKWKGKDPAQNLLVSWENVSTNFFNTTGMHLVAGGLARLLSGEFLKLVALSCLIAFPVAWWLMHNWLLNFAYHTSITWQIFAAAGIGAMGIAGLTVSVQAVKAALANPVNNLRSE
jgi:ABC-type antimicrobial peptide transport system permease subunit